MSKPEIEGYNIVLVGKLNPTIFQPAWFASEGLIRDQERDAAAIEIIHPDVVKFRLDWLNLTVTRENFSVETVQDSYYEALTNLVQGTFSLLSHSPVTMMGLNVSAHHRCRDVESWNAIGHRLAPKEHLWNDLLQEPGMNTLTVQGLRPDGHRGIIRVTVEPSGQVIPGVFVRVNDHYEIEDQENPQGCREMLDILEAEGPASIVRSREIIDAVVERA